MRKRERKFGSAWRRVEERGLEKGIKLTHSGELYVRRRDLRDQQVDPLRVEEKQGRRQRT
jgi:hypothetical protein